MAAVSHHRVVLLLRLGNPDGGTMPAIVRGRLVELQQRATRRSLALAAELVRLVRAFRTAKLDVLTLKGAPLSVQLYGDPCRRAARDIDLLVRPADLTAAAALLHGLGYRDGAGHEETGHKHAELYHPGLDSVVELHVSFDECDAAFPIARLRPFETAVTVAIGGEAVATLAPAAALTFAAFHGAHHFWRRLLWVADMAAAARNPATDWESAFALARRVGVEGFLTLGATLAHDLLGAPLPDPLTRSPYELARARHAAANLRWALAKPLPPSESEMIHHLGRFRWLAWELRLFNRPSNRLELLRYRMRPSETDRRLVRLPRPFRFLYYGLRAARMLAEALPRQRH